MSVIPFILEKKKPLVWQEFLWNKDMLRRSPKYDALNKGDGLDDLKGPRWHDSLSSVISEEL